MEVINSPQGGERPVLLLDVDGVLLVADEVEPKRCPEGWTGVPEGDDYTFYNPEHGQWIKELLPHVDFYWLTSLAQVAHQEIGQHLELPEAAWVNYFRFSNLSEKMHASRYFDGSGDRRAAIDTFFEHRTVMWADDSFRYGDFEWARVRQRDVAPTLLIEVNPREGLQYEDTAQMQAWLGQLSASR